jgi:polysaccharide biosynthesis transport protein
MKTTSYSQPIALMKDGISPQDESGLDLGQVLGALRRRAILVVGVTALVMVAAGLKGSLDVPSYQAQFELLVQPNTAESDVISSLPEALMGRKAQAQGVTPDLLKILSSPKLLVPVVKRFNMQYPQVCAPFTTTGATSQPLGENPNDSCYKFITRNLSVNVVGNDSNIIQVTYEGLNPQQVKSFLDIAAKEYLAYSRQSRQTDIRKGIEFVEGKLPDLRQQVESLQGELQALRQGNNIIDPEARGSQLSGQVGALTQQQLDNEVQLEQAAALAGDLQGQLAGQSPEVAASSALSQNPRYQSLLSRLIELDSKIAEATTVYTDATPDLQVLREERQNLVSLLERESQQVQREVAGQIRELQVRDRSLNRHPQLRGAATGRRFPFFHRCPTRAANCHRGAQPTASQTPSSRNRHCPTGNALGINHPHHPTPTVCQQHDAELGAGCHPGLAPGHRRSPGSQPLGGCHLYPRRTEAHC